MENKSGENSKKINEHLFILGEIGYRSSNKTRMELDIPGIGINQQSAKVGFTYFVN